MAELFKHTFLDEHCVYLEESTPILKQNAETTTINKQAFETGYQDGFAQGIIEGIRKGQQQALDQELDKIKKLSEWLEKIPQALAEGRLNLKTEIADLVLSICQSFFIHQQHHKAIIEQQIIDLISQINHKQWVTIAVHPHDLASLHRALSKINGLPSSKIQLIADKTLNLGGCLIKTEHGVFDASIEHQIDRLKQVLLQIKQDSFHE